jgi:UDP-glucose 4-epimerase
MVHSINANNNPKLSKFALYFHLGFVHAHIILWINDIDVDRIMNEILAMVLVTIDEQSQKFILPDNEHDLTLFKLVEQNKCINVIHNAKQISTLEHVNMDFPLLYLLNNMGLNIQSCKGGSKKIKSSIFLS